MRPVKELLRGLRLGEVGTDRVEVEDKGVAFPDWFVSMAMMASEDRKERTHIHIFNQPRLLPFG